MARGITEIEASGTPEDIGRAIGHAVGTSVHDTVLSQREFAGTYEAFGESAYLASLQDHAEAAYPLYMRELRAMADAADIDPQKLFLWNCRGDLRLSPELAAQRLSALTDGCTTVLCPGDFEAGLPAIIAHNEDGDGAFQAHRYWVRARPNGAPGFESYLYPGMLAGHSVAVTDAGLVQTINNIRCDDLKPGIPRHFVCRAVLDAETIPEVIGHLRRDDRASGFHHAIGMAGEAVPLSVEAPASKAVINMVTSPRAHANHLLDDAFAGLGQVTTSSSAYRQKTCDAYLADGGDARVPTQILFQRSDDGGESVLRRPGDGGDDYGCTLVTAIFEIGPERVTWKLHGGPDEQNILSGEAVV